MSNKRCFWHGVVEPFTEESYKQCSTCHHVYQTEVDFRQKAFELETPEYDDNGKEIEGFSKPMWPEDTPLEDITFCSFCGDTFDRVVAADD